MKILLLSPYPAAIETILSSTDTVFSCNDRINSEEIQRKEIDFIISYGYRHILRSEHLQAVNGLAINLHISFLPWNRGAHPNVWSIVEGTPKGVTIHEIDTGIDTGNILARREESFPEHVTLRESFRILHESLLDLFYETWPSIRSNQVTPTPQDREEGTSHRSRELEALWPLLTNGWDTPLYKVPRFKTGAFKASKPNVKPKQ